MRTATFGIRATVVRQLVPDASAGAAGGASGAFAAWTVSGAASGASIISRWTWRIHTQCGQLRSKVTFIKRTQAGSMAAQSRPPSTSRRRCPATAGQRKTHHNPSGAANSKPSVRVKAAKAQATPVAQNNQGFNSNTARQPKYSVSTSKNQKVGSRMTSGPWIINLGCRA